MADPQGPGPSSLPPTAAPEPGGRSRLRLGEILVRAGVLTADQVKRAREEQIRTALHEQLGVEIVDLSELDPDALRGDTKFAEVRRVLFRFD